MLSQAKITHPGEFIQEYILEEFNLTTPQLAELLGLPEQSIFNLLMNQGRITADISLRLSKFTKTSPELWLNLQNRYDLWDAQHRTGMKEIAKILPYSNLAVHATSQNNLAGI